MAEQHRIVSLLPSATEIVFALGCGDQLVGVSFECDHPPEARTRPVVSRSALPDDAPLSASELDAAVSAAVGADQPIYRLDAELVRELAPDVILAQDLCAVCAVPSGQVDDALATIGCRAHVVSLDPTTLDEVIGGVGLVGEAVDRATESAAMMAELRARVTRVRELTRNRPRVRTLALEWSDPPFDAGHWVPDMIDVAGGEAVLARAGERSRRVEWPVIERAAAEVVVFMPCGYALADAVAEGEVLARRPELAAAAQVWAVAGDAYFSRPGPRVVDGVEVLASVLHPELEVEAPVGSAVRLR